MKSPSIKLKQRRGWSWLSALWLSAFLLTASGVWWSGTSPSVSSSQSQPSAPAKYVTQSIRDLDVVTWVLADNPETDGILGFDYSQEDHRDYRILRVRMVKPSGGLLQLRMLMSLLEMEYRDASRENFIELDYPELDISRRGEVLEVLPCPPIPA